MRINRKILLMELVMSIRWILDFLAEWPKYLHFCMDIKSRYVILVKVVKETSVIYFHFVEIINIEPKWPLREIKGSENVRLKVAFVACVS